MKNAMIKTSMLLLPTLLLAACGGGSSSGTPAATTTPTTTPVATVTTYLGVAAGGGHTVAVKSDGTLLAWGLNRNGQIGDGTSIDKSIPTMVGVTTAATGSIVSAGEFHTLALSGCATAGCTLSAWGSNDSGRLGDGTTVEKRSPAKLTGTNWTDASAGGTHTVAVKKDGTLWGWGNNDKGQLGINSTDTKVSPTAIIDCITAPANGTAPCEKKWTGVTSGSLHAMGIMQSGVVYRWGDNSRGQLGVVIKDVTSFAIPYASSATQKFKSIAAGGDHNLAILNNGSLWAWGANGFGQIGNGTIMDVFAPTPIGTDLNWESISAGGGHNDAGNDQPTNGGHSLAIKTDGTLWAWGANTYGQLGTGTTDDATTPTQVGTDRDWKRVSAGKLHSFGWKADGSLWMWGNNLNGQLGNASSGTTAKNILVPTRLL